MLIKWINVKLNYDILSRIDIVNGRLRPFKSYPHGKLIQNTSIELLKVLYLMKHVHYQNLTF